MRYFRRRSALALAAAAALAVAACSSSGGGSSNGGNANAPVNLTWWHNGTTDPVLSFWKNAAADYHTAHPNVSFTVDPIQNEQFTTKVPLALQGNNFPDIYQQWGGGNQASQVTSGKVADITSFVAPWIGQIGAAAQGWQTNGKQYGVPYDLHVVGFWYRKDLFAQAGITTLPTTLDQLNQDVATLKAHNIVPIAIGSKDRWPDAFYWDEFAVRECSTDTLKTTVKTLKLTDPCWVKAGEDLKTFLATQPFQTGFLGTPAQQGAGSSAGMVANGKAAMELQGDWDPATMQGLTSSTAFKAQIGWFPFPAVAGAPGDPSVALGGGDGFSCTIRAQAACAGFLQYLDSASEQQKFAAQGIGLPVNPAAAASLSDPTLQTALQYTQKASYIQTYFDIAFPTNVGQALDDAVANYFAGQGTPQSIVQQIQNTATGGGK